MSHPVWVRGLKPYDYYYGVEWDMSHPVWVRGLKPKWALLTTHCGRVAPRVGAWIETLYS